VIIGRRWFRKGPGNTYHSAEIIVDGKCVHKIDFAYGYDRTYEYNAFNWSHANGHAPEYDNRSAESPFRYCQEHGIEYTTSVTDVTRKRDL
jgi:hypothetical protein